MAADMLLGHHAGLAAGAHQSAMLPQSLLMAQHHATQQLMLARQDPSSLLSSHAGLVGHHGLSSASGLAVLPGLAAQQGLHGLHDYQHGLLGHQQVMARGELQAGLSQTELNAASGLQQQQQQGVQLTSWMNDQHVQQSSQQDLHDRLRRYVCLLTSHFGDNYFTYLRAIKGAVCSELDHTHVNGHFPGEHC